MASRIARGVISTSGVPILRLGLTTSRPVVTGMPFRREHGDQDIPAAATLLPGVQAFPRPSQGIRPALTIEAIRSVRHRAEIRPP